MQLHTDFATHISELEQPLARPYSEPIDSSLLDSQADIQYLNKEVSSWSFWNWSRFGHNRYFSQN